MHFAIYENTYFDANSSKDFRKVFFFLFSIPTANFLTGSNLKMNIRRRIENNEKVLLSESREKVFSKELVSSLATFLDFLNLLVSGFFIYWYYVGWDNASLYYYSFGIISLSTVVVFTFHKVGLYEITSFFNPKAYFLKILGVLITTLVLFLSLAFALKISDQFSRVWVFSWFIISFPLIVSGREIFSYLFRQFVKTGKITRKIALVGTGRQAKTFINKIAASKNSWIKIEGVFDDRLERNSPAFMGFPILGTIDDLVNFARKNSLDDIIVTLPWDAHERLSEIISTLEELPVNVRLDLNLTWFHKFNFSFSSFLELPMLSLVSKPLEGGKFLLKFFEDKVLALLLLILLSPLMVIIAIAVKLESPGPILFKQKRFGFNNKKFSVLKFRTMYHNPGGDIGVKQAQLNDSRITPLGKFLRRTSLDELPQLFNVLEGAMSVVGPRPHAVEHNEKYSKIIQGYFSRHRVKPGITGWAQVKGFRGETDVPGKMEARVEHDVFYIKNWSLLFDIKILLLTLLVVPFQKNAY
jgi:Undecaprenyl-phosphate glucose phosphotransferase